MAACPVAAKTGCRQPAMPADWLQAGSSAAAGTAGCLQRQHCSQQCLQRQCCLPAAVALLLAAWLPAQSVPGQPAA